MNNKEKINLLLLCTTSLLVKRSEINDSSSASSSSSNEDKQQQTIIAIYEATKRTKHNKSNHWYNNVVLTLEDIEFKKHFRITRSTFQYLCEELIPILQRRSIF